MLEPRQRRTVRAGALNGVLALVLLGWGSSWLLLGHGHAGLAPVGTLEAESLLQEPPPPPVTVTVVDDASASAGKAIKYTANATAAGDVFLGADATSLIVTARGDQCSGAPRMVVLVDGAQVLDTAVPTTGWSDIAAGTVSIPAGTRRVSVRLTNFDVRRNGPNRIVCQRQLYVDQIRFSREVPAPTVSISADPTSVEHGATSLLTWTSSNASACTAAGPNWSGSGTSGTESVSPQASASYTARCQNDGGAACAFVRVTVDGAPQQPVLGDVFPIGVDIQPTTNFNTWKSRGVNTVLRVPEGHDLELWATAASDAGLFQIRAPRADAAADGRDPMVAWTHPDEPDGINTQVPYSVIQDQYCNWKNLAPTLPVFVNFIGKLNQFDRATSESGDDWYRKYIQGADWVSGDIYPVNERLALSTVGQMVDHLRAISDDRPVFAYIESADINPRSGGPAPSPDELRAEVWSAIIHGARGIWYFPIQVSPFRFDATPKAVAAEMTAQNARITGLAAVLQGEIDPAGVDASAPAPIEVGWRTASSGTYVIALNLSRTTLTGQQISLEGVSAGTATVYEENRSVPIVEGTTPGTGTITDTFGPYAVHIYVVP